MMTRRTRSMLILGLVWSLALGVAQVMAADQGQVMKVGKKGDIHFSEPTTVGTITLKPGNYQLQHRVENGEHYIHFTEIKHSPSRDEHYARGGVSGAAHPGEVQCKLEPLDKKVESTAVYVDTEGGARRITKIEIAGENVAHVF